MPTIARAAVLPVVMQHVGDAVALRNMRRFQAWAPHVRLRHLGRLDERLAAHLDGIAVAGDVGAALVIEGLESPGVGEVFAAAISAIHAGEPGRLDRLFALAQAVPESQAGLRSAFGWVSAHTLRGIVTALLGDADPFRQRVGIAACAMHRVDPGDALDTAAASSHPGVLARAMRCAGEIGRRNLLQACIEREGDAEPDCAFWAGRSAVLLGGRGRSVEMLNRLCLLPNPYRGPAFRLVLKLLAMPDAHALLASLAQQTANHREVLRGAGIAGDPFYVPWLIAQMSDLKTARLAGESFSLITGLDLAYLDLEIKPPKNFRSGPTDNPDDDDVAMDEDDGLPWPDPVKLQAWWDVNQRHFEPGVRYFMGERVTVEHCKKVLREGFQRQRVAAAEYLCLLTPGTPLFPTSAPAWRQQRWLAQMG